MRKPSGFPSQGKGGGAGGPLQRNPRCRKADLQEDGFTQNFRRNPGSLQPSPTFSAQREGAATTLGCARPATRLASSHGPPGFSSAPLWGSPCAPGCGPGTGLPRDSWLTRAVLAPPLARAHTSLPDRAGPNLMLWLTKGGRGRLALSLGQAA